ncbi:MAG: LapA family protein, partial [Deltaproteobacteria bacterium]|nr:LapA family protein [Deltaproteobacteria bacterium]
EPVGVHLFWWEISAPASVAVFVAFAAGILVGSLLFWTDQRRARKRQPPTPPTTTALAKTQKNWWW